MTDVGAFRDAVTAWAAGGAGDTAREPAARLSVRTAVLLEGASDLAAVDALAAGRGRDLAAEGVCVLPMGGAMSVGRFTSALGPPGLGLRLTGLCMDSVELGDLTADFAHLIRRVEESGERVKVTDAGVPAGVLLPSAELAELEHFAQRVRGSPRPWSGTIRPSCAGPQRQGLYVRYAHSDAVRMTFAQDHLVVAELRSVAEFAWLEERARAGRQGSMDSKQAAAFEEFLARRRPAGDGIAWIAGSWREQEPFTVLEFVKGPTPEAVALGYGADAQDVADGVLLHQVRERNDREGGNDFLDALAFGEADGWTWLGHHDFDGALSPALDPPPAQRITLTATMAKGLYQFGYARDGVYQNPFPLEHTEDGRHDMYELIWYTPGRTPFAPDAPLGFLNPHIRRAEEQTDHTDGISLFFAGLERAFGLSLPREALVSGQVRCARPARAARS